MLLTWLLLAEKINKFELSFAFLIHFLGVSLLSYLNLTVSRVINPECQSQILLNLFYDKAILIRKQEIGTKLNKLLYTLNSTSKFHNLFRQRAASIRGIVRV